MELYIKMLYIYMVNKKGHSFSKPLIMKKDKNVYWGGEKIELTNMKHYQNIILGYHLDKIMK